MGEGEKVLNPKHEIRNEERRKCEHRTLNIERTMDNRPLFF